MEIGNSSRHDYLQDPNRRNYEILEQQHKIEVAEHKAADCLMGSLIIGGGGIAFIGIGAAAEFVGIDKGHEVGMIMASPFGAIALVGGLGIVKNANSAIKAQRQIQRCKRIEKKQKRQQQAIDKNMQ